jgi:hypothetical protein
MDSLDWLGMVGVGKGWMLSYRNMCRWNSGFFYNHPRLVDYEFYWRVEPDVGCLPYYIFDSADTRIRSISSATSIMMSSALCAITS